jgi:O-acetyl-ADP-ribose deacetylase (regulator of RNase III)
MIHYAHGNLLEAKAEALVNTVNTVGVMGKGIALMFKDAFRGNFKEYEGRLQARRCPSGQDVRHRASRRASVDHQFSYQNALAPTVAT